MRKFLTCIRRNCFNKIRNTSRNTMSLGNCDCVLKKPFVACIKETPNIPCAGDNIRLQCLFQF